MGRRSGTMGVRRRDRGSASSAVTATSNRRSARTASGAASRTTGGRRKSAADVQKRPLPTTKVGQAVCILGPALHHQAQDGARQCPGSAEVHKEVGNSPRDRELPVAILEDDPQTFIIPNHRDAETIIFIAKGRGSVSIMTCHDKRESFNLRLGDVMRIPAGTTVYLINRSNNEKLVIVKLLQPVSSPGHFETFFGPGGEDPESYYKAFSTELLEAALVW